MAWDELIRLPRWIPLRAIGLHTSALSERLRKVHDGKYLVALESDARGDDAEGPYVTMVVWAESDGAALRAIDFEKEADDQQSRGENPPVELLPQGAEPSYGSIVAALRESKDDFLESGEYRIATDSAFVHKTVHSSRADYCFRSRRTIATEKPYAVIYRLQESSVN